MRRAIGIGLTQDARCAPFAGLLSDYTAHVHDSMSLSSRAGSTAARGGASAQPPCHRVTRRILICLATTTSAPPPHL